jgi:hypothetical protein
MPSESSAMGLPVIPVRGAPRGGRSRERPRRAADRHYLAVVTEEARRLGRQLRPLRERRGASASRASQNSQR